MPHQLSGAAALPLLDVYEWMDGTDLISWPTFCPLRAPLAGHRPSFYLFLSFELLVSSSHLKSPSSSVPFLLASFLVPFPRPIAFSPLLSLSSLGFLLRLIFSSPPPLILPSCSARIPLEVAHVFGLPLVSLWLPSLSVACITSQERGARRPGNGDLALAFFS